MDEIVDEENAEDAAFIDDSSNVCFSAKPSFYREIDINIEATASNIDRNHMEHLNFTCNNYREWLISPDSEVQNYTSFSEMNPEYDNFNNEEVMLSKFDSVCHSVGENSKDSFFNAILLGFCRKLSLRLEGDQTADGIDNNKTLQKLRKIKDSL